MDQDRFEATGFAYRMIEELGFQEAPAFLIERVKASGRWLDGPVLGNVFPGWVSEALALWGARHYRRQSRHVPRHPGSPEREARRRRALADDRTGHRRPRLVRRSRK